jgi:hypothetical protein
MLNVIETYDKIGKVENISISTVKFLPNSELA